jgi:hypothetical protein
MLPKVSNSAAVGGTDGASECDSIQAGHLSGNATY